MELIRSTLFCKVFQLSWTFSNVRRSPSFTAYTDESCAVGIKFSSIRNERMPSCNHWVLYSEDRWPFSPQTRCHVLCLSLLTYFRILLYLAHAQKTPEDGFVPEQKTETIFELQRFLRKARAIIDNYWMRFLWYRGKCYQPKPKAEADNTNRDLDYSGYHKNRI